jgi:hypothetical protein
MGEKFGRDTVLAIRLLVVNVEGNNGQVEYG